MPFRSRFTLLVGVAVALGGGIAEAQYNKATVSTYTTTSAVFENVPGGSLTFTPTRTSDVWVLLLSAKLSCTVTTGRAAELRYLVDGTERGLGGANNSPVDNPDGWQHFYRVTGTTAPQTVQVQIQTAAGSSATVEDLQIIAFRLPDGADVQYSEWQSPPDPDPVSVPTTFTGIAPSLTFTPSAAGNYLVMAVAAAHEDPASSFVGVRLRDPAGTDWPVDHDADTRRGHWGNGREAWRTFFVARVETLDTTSKTYTIQGTSDVGGPNSEMRYHRIMAFRTDAFETVESAQAPGSDLLYEAAPATTPTVKSTVITAPPPGPRDYIVIQNIYHHAAGSTTDSRNVGFEADDVPTSTLTKIHNSAELSANFTFFDARTTGSSVKYENTFWTSNLAYNVFAKESVIHILRLPRDRTKYRSIGTRSNYGTLEPEGATTTVTATNGSTIVTGSAGTDWTGANRGRGDRIRIEGVDYTVWSVDSPTELTLTAAYGGATGPGKTYTLARQFATLAAWYDCISAVAPCAFFPVSSANLVADNRSEVGVTFKDSTFTGGVDINLTATDADHTITLTAAQGNRHYGIAGGGVVIDMQGLNATSIGIDDEFVTVEWLEITGMGNGGKGVHLQSNGSPQKNIVRNLLMHSSSAATGIDFNDGGVDAEIYNNIIYRLNRGIEISTDPTQALIFNNTIFASVASGPPKAGGIQGSMGPFPGIVLRNNIVHSNVNGDIDVPGINAASSHNVTGDGSGVLHSPAGGGQDNVLLGSLNFVDTNMGTEDLHIQSPSAAEDCGGVPFQPCEASSVFTFDIDGGARLAPWDVGADDIAATTAVELVSFEAAGVSDGVELRWETASELDNLAFHLYRSIFEAGPYERITERPIPGLGSSPVGARYSYRDTGLDEGTTYFYKLEDIETTGRTEFHGPLTATAGASSGGPTDSEASPARITYGDPARNELRVVKRGQGFAVLELWTEGFHAEPQADGTVQLEVPDFELLDDGIPVRRSWVEAIAGRKVEIASVRASDVEGFRLRPSGAEAMEIVVTAQGTFRATRSAGRRLAAFRRPGLYPIEAARISSIGFQEDKKKALVELAPLRWDGSRQELLLARRLRVRLTFSGRDDSRKLLRTRRRRDDLLVRFVTTERGLHAVRFEDVFGTRPALSTGEIRLSRQGQTVPFHVAPDGNWFGRTSVLYFVSEGASSNPYGDEAIYELEVGVPGEVMPEVSALPSGEPVPHYWQRLAREEDRYYQAALLEAPDRWLWDLLFAPETDHYPFEVTALASSTEPSKLNVWLQGASDLLANPDHHVRVSVNGNFLGEASWNGKEPKRVDAEISPGILREGENLLELENVGDTAASYSMVMLDRFELQYQRRTESHGGKIEGRFDASGVAEVAGLETGAIVLDVTGEIPRWLRASEVGADGVLRFRVEAGNRYLAVSAASVLPAGVRRVPVSTLMSTQNLADYLVIGPRSFVETADPLLRLRQSQGLRVKAVAIEEIFSEFGYGETMPEALKEFLTYAYHYWQKPSPRYVLLLGDATYDFKDHLGTGARNHVPPWIAKTSYLWTASDPAYASVHGEDPLPDLAIGRLPAASVEEARAMVQKIVAYETGSAGLGRAPVVLVADDPDRAGDFEADASRLAQGVLAPRHPKTIYVSELGAGGTREAVIQAFDQGASLMSYLGHGGIHLWADENVFNTSQVPSLAPQSQQPVLLTMNCLNGLFHFPYFDSLAEELVKAGDKGAIAVFSPSGFSLNQAADRFHVALLEQLLGGSHERLGDAVLAAQAAYADSGLFPELLTIYHLFGDPATTLR